MLLRVYLLGQPRLRFEGEPLSFRVPARALSLLAYLLLRRGSALERDAIAFDFWPDLSEAEARKKLRAHLHYLVTALPAADRPWLLADKRSIQWNPGAPVWVDVEEFERLSGDPVTAAQAVELYSGDLLRGHDDDWFEVRRTALRERQIALLLELIESSRSSGDRTRTNQYATQMLATDPWREEAVRALIALRAETGDRAGALNTYLRFAQELKDELGIEPATETTSAYLRVRSPAATGETDAGSTAVRAPNNLPSYLTSFVDRTEETATVQAALSERRLVTLIGPGGVGKTRLAVEAVRALVDGFTDGVWMVELGSLADGGAISSAIAGAIGLVDGSESGVAGALQHRKLLLIFDNCEHLPTLPRLVDLLLRQCPGVRVLATSREPLRATGERIERISSLPIPTAAVQLFMDRVADVASPIAFGGATEEDRRALVTIVQRLDGLPLAIELAAARAGTLTLSALVERLEGSFAFLNRGSRAVLPRHQTLRATIDWSYDALDSVEQCILARVGIFAGGWDLAASSALCTDFGLESWELQDRLASLVDKSLVIAERSGENFRYRLLETMRAYALEKLHDKGERDSASLRHARYYAELAQENVTRRYSDGAWCTTVKSELQNLRAALRWTIELGNDPALGALLAESLAWFAHNTTLSVEALNRCEEAVAALGSNASRRQEGALALARSRCLGFLQSQSEGFVCERRAVDLLREGDDAPSLAYAMSFLADALWRAEETAEARSVAEEATAIARNGGDVRTLAHVLSVRARVTRNLEEKRQLFLEAVDAYRSIDSRQGMVKALLQIAECAFEAGDAAAALRSARECIESLYEGVEAEQHPLTIVRNNAAAYALALGHVDEARAFAIGALVLAQRIGDRRRAAWALQHLAGVAFARGEMQRAAHLLGASEESLRLAITRERSFTEISGHQNVSAGLAAAFTEHQLAELIAQGRRWTVEEAMSEV